MYKNFNIRTDSSIAEKTGNTPLTLILRSNSTVCFRNIVSWQFLSDLTFFERFSPIKTAQNFG